MERSLGLMCGAGELPARMAAEARRQGWRVVAFAFPDANAIEADRVVTSRIEAIGPILAALAQEKVTAVAFAGKFWMRDLLGVAAPDPDHARLAARAGALVDADITRVIVETLEGLGIELLDQRSLLGDWLGGERCWSARAPDEAAWSDVRRGLAVARLAADASVGQTVVVRRGVVGAVEAVEGTTEAIRRGTALVGPGATIVKAAARAHDFRFDTPAIGPETITAAAEGGAVTVAIEAGRVLIVDRETVVAGADAAGIALVSVAVDG